MTDKCLNKNWYQLTGKELFYQSEINDVLIIRRHNYSDLKLKIIQKTESTMLVQALNDGVIGQGYHIYNSCGFKENFCLSKEDESYISLINKNLFDCICISFTDNANMVQDLKSKIRCNDNLSFFAKIETPYGVKNMNNISKEVDGLIIARDDLSAWYSVKDIEEISEQIIDLCYYNKKISIPASNYFQSLCESCEMDLQEYCILENLKRLGLQYIYCNETNKYADWKRFRKIEEYLGV